MIRNLFSLALILFSLLLFSCTPTTTPAPPEIVTVFSTTAAEPWLPSIYNCAGMTSVISRVDDPDGANLALQVGEPKVLHSFAYQIDTEDILIVTPRQSPIQYLTLDQARLLFTGQGDPSIQVWVYAPQEDVQEVFDQFVMTGMKVTPSARIAATPQQMLDTLVSDPNTVGILPRHWKAGDDREVFKVATVPVLVLTRLEPQGAMKDILACLQK